MKNDIAKKDLCNAKIKNIENITPDITNLATKTNLNVKTNDVKVEIPDFNNLSTTSALTPVENEKSSVINLAKKPDYNTKINEFEKKITDHNHDKYVITPELNKFTAKSFDLRLKEQNLESKRNIAIS